MVFEAMMHQVAKLLVIDQNDTYLMLTRSNPPAFGNDPDLPGGTIEDGEQPIAAMVREVYEEAGITIKATDVRQLYEGTEYSQHGTHYSLFTTTVGERPSVTISWEHAGYEWLNRDEFLAKAKAATDTYMQMVYEQLK